MGVVSAIGNNLSENHLSLRNQETGIGKAKYLNSKYADGLLFGEVKLSNEELKSRIKNNIDEELTRTELLAFMAFEEAIYNADLSDADLQDYDTALLSATTVSGMVEMEAIYADANTNTESSPYVNSYRSGAHTLQLARVFGLKGYTDTLNTACSSSANAIMQGARMLKAGKWKRAIVGKKKRSEEHTSELQSLG